MNATSILRLQILARETLSLLVYGALFVLLHRLAAQWGHDSAFSLWFPAAGLRFAAMWTQPLRMVPVIALTELVAQILSGGILPSFAILTIIGTLNSPLCYGLAIALIRTYLSSRRSGLSTPPMPMGLAMLLAPAVAVIGSLPWAMAVGPTTLGPANLQRALSESGIFWIGDLLGIWMIAPPLLWLWGQRFTLPTIRLTAKHWEALSVVAAGWAITGLTSHFTGTVHIEPVMLSAVWIALRLGRMAAWIVGAVATLVILLLTKAPVPLEGRANLHLLAASFSITAFLVGCYAEAERTAQHDLERAQRLLLRADRLKSLRAMSLAAIHDISQPLATLSLEARHAREMAMRPEIDRQEMIETSELIERKTNHLADLVKRMRNFGSDGNAGHEIVAIDTLLTDVASLTRAEADMAGVALRTAPSTIPSVTGCRVELQQALVNLVRNAIAATPGGTVILRARQDGEFIFLDVLDDGTAGASSPGMGLGLIIARTIIEAHGGILRSGALEPCGSCYTLGLPRRAGQ